MAKQVPGNVRRLLSRIADGVYVTSITTPPKGFRGSVENWRQTVTQARRMGLIRTYRPNLKKGGIRLIEPSAKGYAVLG